MERDDDIPRLPPIVGLAGDETVDETLKRLAAVATTVIDACDSCGVTLLGPGGTHVRAASDESADLFDALQERTGEGPCLTAIATGAPVRATFADEGPWPQLCAEALRHGGRASYSVPLRLGERIVGSINYYSHGEPFGPLDEQLGDLLADQAVIALYNADLLGKLLAARDQLEQALESRDVIGQAKGILMASRGLDADAAFTLLREESQHRNLKLRDVAVDVVRRHSTSPAAGG